MPKPSPSSLGGPNFSRLGMDHKAEKKARLQRDCLLNEENQSVKTNQPHFLIQSPLIIQRKEGRRQKGKRGKIGGEGGGEASEEREGKNLLLSENHSSCLRGKTRRLRTPNTLRAASYTESQKVQLPTTARKQQTALLNHHPLLTPGKQEKGQFKQMTFQLAMTKEVFNSAPTSLSRLLHITLNHSMMSASFLFKEILQRKR